MQHVDSDVEDINRSYRVSVPRSFTFLANANTVNMSRVVNRLSLFTFSQCLPFYRLDLVRVWTLAVPLVFVLGSVATHTGLGRLAFWDLKG